MVFSSLLFLFRFLPAVLVLYFLAPRKSGISFYFCSVSFLRLGEPRYVFLMLFSITMDYTVGRFIDRYKAAGEQKRRQRGPSWYPLW